MREPLSPHCHGNQEGSGSETKLDWCRTSEAQGRFEAVGGTFYYLRARLSSVCQWPVLSRSHGSPIIICKESVEATTRAGHEAKRTVKHPWPMPKARRGLVRVQSGLTRVLVLDCGAEGSSPRPSSEGKIHVLSPLFSCFSRFSRPKGNFSFLLKEVLEELSHVEDHVQALDAEHSSLCVAIDLVCNRLRIPRLEDSFA